MPHARPGLTARLLEDAYAFNEARDQYEAWHLRQFHVPPTPPPPPPATTRGPRKPRVTLICPRCGTSRRASSTNAGDPLALCRACQAALIPLVPKEHRRRGFATAEGYRIARRRELDNARAATARAAIDRATVSRKRTRQQRASKFHGPTGGAQ